MKTFFNEDYTWKDEGLALDREVQNIIRPIMEKYMNEGYNPMEIEAIIMEAASMARCLYVMKSRYETAKKNKETQEA